MYPTPSRTSHATASRCWKQTARAYERGVAGGQLVAMPLLMTMEMWWLGFYMLVWKVLLFVAVNSGVLLILEYCSGLR